MCSCSWLKKCGGNKPHAGLGSDGVCLFSPRGVIGTISWLLLFCYAVAEGARPQFNKENSGRFRDDTRIQSKGYEQDISARFDSIKDAVKSVTRERLGGELSQKIRVKEGCGRECPDTLRPLCGSDGITYLNDCEYEVALCSNPRLTLAKRNMCNPSDLLQDGGTAVMLGHSTSTVPPIATGSPTSLRINPPPRTTVGTEAPKARKCPSDCLAITSPVCGSDGMTYVNFCYMLKAACHKNEDVHVVGNGVCQNESAKQEKTTTPAPSTEGARGYLHAALDSPFESSASVKRREAVTASRQECSRNCRDSIAPVCGGEGQTYLNLCRLREAHCISGVTFLHMGPCVREDDTSPHTNAPSKNVDAVAVSSTTDVDADANLRQDDDAESNTGEDVGVISGASHPTDVVLLDSYIPTHASTMNLLQVVFNNNKYMSSSSYRTSLK